jgi:hypothetical protein
VFILQEQQRHQRRPLPSQRQALDTCSVALRPIRPIRSLRRPVPTIPDLDIQVALYDLASHDREPSKNRLLCDVRFDRRGNPAMKRLGPILTSPTGPDYRVCEGCPLKNHYGLTPKSEWLGRMLRSQCSICKKTKEPAPEEEEEIEEEEDEEEAAVPQVPPSL